MRTLRESNEYRRRMNDRILGSGNLGIRRFFALDSRAYEAGDLDEKTKELLGLATSAVLRCDDCVTYHVIKCIQLGTTDEELLARASVAPSRYPTLGAPSTPSTSVGSSRPSTGGLEGLL